MGQLCFISYLTLALLDMIVITIIQFMSLSNSCLARHYHCYQFTYFSSGIVIIYTTNVFLCTTIVIICSTSHFMYYCLLSPSMGIPTHKVALLLYWGLKRQLVEVSTTYIHKRMHQHYAQRLVWLYAQEWGILTVYHEQKSEILIRYMSSHRLNSQLKFVLVHIVIVLRGLTLEYSTIILYMFPRQYYQTDTYILSLVFSFIYIDSIWFLNIIAVIYGLY